MSGNETFSREKSILNQSEGLTVKKYYFPYRFLIKSIFDYRLASNQKNILH